MVCLLEQTGLTPNFLHKIESLCCVVESKLCSIRKTLFLNLCASFDSLGYALNICVLADSLLVGFDTQTAIKICIYHRRVIQTDTQAQYA